MRKKLAVSGAASLVILVLAAYLGIGALMYNRISSVKAGCEERPEDMAYTPSSFSAPSDEARAQADMSGYEMSAYQEAQFPSREDRLTIEGWYVPAQGVDEASAPAVILVHGLNDCKRTPYILMPAGMLNRAGFNVLMIDLRDHGDSQVEDGRFAGGTEEYRDALGAWDWLVNEKHIPPERIGLFGTSLGAATVLITMGEEPRVAAAWEDSSYADIQVAIDAELTRYGVPTFFEPAGILMGKLLAGDDIAVRSPLAAVSRLNGRPVFITHGDADTRLSVQYAYDLADAIRANGGQVEPWIVNGSGHIDAMFDDTAEYEQKLVAFFKDAIGG
jgi:dipeptidyl aminopeptidase/acylaminoacyl peptidase